MHIRKSIFFTRDLARVQLSRYQGRQKQSKNRKLTKSSMKTRQFIFFTQLFGRVQLLKKFLLVLVEFEQILDVYTLIFVSSTYRVYFIIFFLKSTVFSMKKEPFLYEKKNGLLLFILRLMIEQGMGCLVDVLSSVCVVHGVEMYPCYVLRYQVHDLVYSISKSCCSE